MRMTKLSISRAWDDCRDILARESQLIAPVALALFVVPGIVLGVTSPLAQSGQMSKGVAGIVIAAVFVISLIGQLSIARLALVPQISVGEAIAHGARRVL